MRPGLRRILRWLGYGAAGLLALLLLFAGFVYAVSGLAFRRTYEAEAHPVLAPDDSASIAEGARLAKIRGCYGACHGEGGGLVVDEPFIAAGAIPDLTRLVREYDDARLERAIRHGIKPDGRSVIEFMPSAMFSHLSDQDFGAIVAFLRSLPEANGPEGGLRFKPLARAMIAIGRMGFAAEQIDEPVTHSAPDRSDPIEFGRYLALTSCTECHGSDLAGSGGMLAAPDLRIAGAYSLEQFTRLMREGVPPDGRDLGLMGRVSRDRFSNFSDEEIASLHAYLRGRARE